MKKEKFYKISNYIEEIKKIRKIDSNLSILIIGNKNDLNKDNEEMIKEISKKLNFDCKFTSAKENENLNEIFQQIVKLTYKNMKEIKKRISPTVNVMKRESLKEKRISNLSPTKKKEIPNLNLNTLSSSTSNDNEKKSPNSSTLKGKLSNLWNTLNSPTPKQSTLIKTISNNALNQFVPTSTAGGSSNRSSITNSNTTITTTNTGGGGSSSNTNLMNKLKLIDEEDSDSEHPIEEDGGGGGSGSDRLKGKVRKSKKEEEILNNEKEKEKEKEKKRSNLLKRIKSIDEILKNEKLKKYFRNYLEKEFNENCLNFYEEIERFKLKETTDLFQESIEIISKFILPKSSEEIPIENEERNFLMLKYKNIKDKIFPIDFFDSLQLKSIQILEIKFLKKFLLSDDFIEYLFQIENILFFENNFYESNKFDEILKKSGIELDLKNDLLMKEMFEFFYF